MATKNIVPRATGEGGLGTLAKGWGGLFVMNTTTSSATEGGKIVLAADDGAVMGSGHRLGIIEFKGAEDGASTLSTGARIQAIANLGWGASENGTSLEFWTTTGTSETAGMVLTSGNQLTVTGAISAGSGVIIADGVNINAVQTSGETFQDNDASIMTSAAIDDRIAAAGGGISHDGSTANGVLTYKDADEATVEANLTFDGTTLITTGSGGITLNDATTSSATEGGHLTLIADDGAALASGHRLGVIEFKGAEDASSTLSNGARIECVTHSLWSGSNNAAHLDFYTTAPNGVDILALSLDGYNNRDATFGGDVICNEIRATGLTTTSFSNTKGMFLDVDTSGVGAQDATGMHIDFDRAVAGSGTAAHNDIGLNLDVNSASLGTSTLTGIDLDVVGTTAGTSTAIGIDIDVDTADTNIGMIINTAGTHMKLVANADANDYATFTLADTGDLTIQTVGSGTTDSDMTLTVDGNIALNAGTTSVNSTDIPLRKYSLPSSTVGEYSGGDVYYYGSGSTVKGQIYYMASGGGWTLTDADTEVASKGLLAVALGTDPDVDGMLLRGFVTLLTEVEGTEAIGSTLYLSATAGVATFTVPGSGDFVRVIGYSLHATDNQVYFNPAGTFVEVA